MIDYSGSCGKSNEKTWMWEAVEADFRKSSDKMFLFGMLWTYICGVKSNKQIIGYEQNDLCGDVGIALCV